MTDQSTEALQAEQAGGPPPVTDLLAGAEPKVPWQPPDRCLYRDLLGEVIDPELGVDIINLGLVYDVKVADGTAQVRMTMTTPGCPLGAYFDDSIRECMQDAPGVEDVDLEIVWDPPWNPEMMTDAAKAQLGWMQ